MLKTYTFYPATATPGSPRNIHIVANVDTAEDLIELIFGCMNVQTQTGRPVDLFINPVEEQLCYCVYIDPDDNNCEVGQGTGKRIIFEQRFVGQCLFGELTPVELDALAQNPPPVGAAVPPVFDPLEGVWHGSTADLEAMIKESRDTNEPTA